MRKFSRLPIAYLSFPLLIRFSIIGFDLCVCVWDTCWTINWNGNFSTLYNINRCQRDQENIKVSIEMLVYSRIKLKAYKTNLFLFRGKRKKFYVPIEHVIQQAFIGIFRINSLGTWWDILYPFYRYYSVEIDFKSLYWGFCEKMYVNRYFYNKVFCSVVSAEWIFQSFDERWLIADIRVYKSFS